MKHTRIIVTHYGGPDALQVLEEECPEPKGGEVLVRVLAAGVSLPDLMMREGVHPETPPLPFTPGGDLIGVVERLGDGVAWIQTSPKGAASAVADLGGIPLDYRRLDFVKEIHRLASEGVDVVFDGIGGTHIWRSRKALRPGGKVVAYGLTSSLRGGRLASGRRHRFHGLAIFGLYIAGGWVLPSRRRVVPYSIQWLKRLRPALFRQDLIALFELLQQQKIKPLIARRFPLAEARHAHELLGKGGVTGKIVLVRNASSLESRSGVTTACR